MTSERAIRIQTVLAFNNALDGEIVPSKPTKSFDVGTAYQEPDTHLLDIDDSPLVATEGRLVVHSLEDLHTALLCVDDYHGGKVGRAVVQSITDHESRHAEAGMHVGFKKSLFGITMRRSDEYVVSWNAFYQGYDLAMPMTKLGFASLCSAPSDPSDSDLNEIRALGYDSVETVTERVRVHNLSFPERPYMMPGSTV